MSLVRSAAPYAKIAVMVDSTHPRTPRRWTQFHTCSACDPSRCAQGPCHQPSARAFFWLSWRLQARAYASWWAEGPSMFLRSLQRTSQKKSAGFTKVGRARRSPRCQRSPNAFRYNASPVFPRYPSHFEAAVLRHRQEDQDKFPPEVYRWENGLARSRVWRFPRQKKENSFWVSDGAIPPPSSASSAVWRHPLSLRKLGCQFSAARLLSVAISIFCGHPRSLLIFCDCQS